MTTAAHRLTTAVAALLGAAALAAAAGAPAAHASSPCSGLPGSDNGQTYADGTVIKIKSIRTGAEATYQCQDGVWVKVSPKPRPSAYRPAEAMTVQG